MKRLLASLWLLAAPAAFADPAPAPSPNAPKCEALRFADLAATPDAPTKIMEAALAPAKGELPEACVVRGYVAPQVGIEMLLPTERWNGKLIEIGSGGFAGTLFGGGCEDSLRRGYACVHSDQGHTAATSDKAAAPLDGLWAYQNPQAELDYAFRSVHVVTLAARAIAQQYYAAPARKNYFFGCSNGGRQAMVAAQRYPRDFDGVLAMEPAMNLSGAFLTFLYGYKTVTDSDGKPLFASTDLDLLHRSAVEACDAGDGLKDGIVGDPRRCKFDPAKLACVAGQKEGCLSPEQVTAAKRMYAGPVDSKGHALYRGHVMPGAERGVFGFGVTKPVAALALQDFFRYLAFVPDAGPAAKLSDFDMDRDPPRLATMEALYEASNPDLRAFKESGGKLLMVQGWDDSGTPFPLNTIDYYETMQRTMGGAKNTRDFARLFMVPGREHCVGGDGATAADYFGALETWVEQGRAPEQIRAAHLKAAGEMGDYFREPRDPAAAAFTRPLYPYPLAARYRGKGDANDWQSFAPVDTSAP